MRTRRVDWPMLKYKKREQSADLDVQSVANEISNDAVQNPIIANKTSGVRYEEADVRSKFGPFCSLARLQ